MPRRYDAHDYITEYAEMEPMRRYIQSKRREGVRISYMALILAAYFKAYQQHPKINRFIMNSKIYQRNHFCVSFVILKTRADGTPDETSVKIFFEDGDDVISINRKIEDAVALNQKKEHNNNTDRFANFMFSLPVLPTLLVGLVKLLDRLGLLPRFVIDLSPFHTRPLHHEPRQHQHGGHLPPLLRVRHDGRVRLHGQARPQLPHRRIQQEDHAARHRDGRAHLHGPRVRALLADAPPLSQAPRADGERRGGARGDAGGSGGVRGNRALLAFPTERGYAVRHGGDRMETKNVIYELRTGKGMSQDELAEKLFVTRQAVSRWENGETVPNTETLKLLSRLFNVSINTLLGSPRQLICQCCGMPLEEASLSRELDGAINEDYCKWCYANGKFALIRAWTSSSTSARSTWRASNGLPGRCARMAAGLLPTLKHWQAAE